MGSGTGIDPTMDSAGGSSRQAYNANVIAAVETVFGANDPVGVLPVNIPVIEEAPDGTLKYGTEILYERGFSVK